MAEHPVTERGARAKRRADVAASADAAGPRGATADPLFSVRASDVEPYTGLGYLSKLFRIIAVLLVVLLVFEIATGLYTTGSAAVPTLLQESSRLIVLAGLLWGVGDLATLLIDVGHDVRATRILIGRQTAVHAGEPPRRDGAGAADGPS